MGWSAKTNALLAVGATLTACSLAVNLDHLSDGNRTADDAGGDGASPPGPSPAADAGNDASGAVDAGIQGDGAAGTAGLVGHWAFSETSGTVAEDSSPLRNAGVLVGGPVWVPSTAGRPAALSFDGVDDYVEIAGNVTYATQHAAFSFSAWFNVTDFSSSTVEDIMQLRTDNDTPWHVLLSNDPNWMGVSVGSAGGWATIKTGSVPTTGTWHHVAVTYNGSDPTLIINFEITLDGATQGLVASSGYGGQPEESRIGESGQGTPFKGFIRDVRIYSRALSPTEIADIYAGRF